MLEASGQVGGKIAAVDFAGRRLDVGAEMVLARVPEALELIEAVGLSDQLIHPRTTSAAIALSGRLVPIPAGTLLGVPVSAEDAERSGLFSAATIDLLRAHDADPAEVPAEDVSVGGFLRPRLGDEVVDRLVEPLLGGVYAGRADQLSLRATMAPLAAALAEEPSVLRAAAAARRDPADGPVFATLRGGLAQLASAVAGAPGMDVRTGVTVHGIEGSATGFVIRTGPRPAAETIEADAVVLAAPPPKAATLLSLLVPAAAAGLAEIPMASMAIVTLRWPDQPVPEGSGLLVPATEGKLVKAVTVTSNKWPHREDAGVLVRASIGRIGEEATLRRSDADLIAVAAAEVAGHLGLTGPPTEALVTRWGGGLPQYTVGHLDRVRAIRAAVAEVPGLAVAGAAYDGVGVPACIRSARAAVAALLG